MIADRNLYLDKSGLHLVAEGSAESASMLAGAGQVIDEVAVVRLGLALVDGQVCIPADTPPADDEPKKKPAKGK